MSFLQKLHDISTFIFDEIYYSAEPGSKSGVTGDFCFPVLHVAVVLNSYILSN